MKELVEQLKLFLGQECREKISDWSWHKSQCHLMDVGTKSGFSNRGDWKMIDRVIRGLGG
jgi:hypothetical protein